MNDYLFITFPEKRSINKATSVTVMILLCRDAKLNKFLISTC